LTDTVLAVVSHYMKYKSDMIVVWSYFSKRWGFVSALVIIVSFMSCMLITNVPTSLCYSSTMDNIED